MAKEKCNAELNTTINAISETLDYPSCTHIFYCGLEKGHEGDHERKTKISWENIKIGIKNE